YGDWRVDKVKARTVLPDGTAVDASENIHHGKSDSGIGLVSVAFPKVQVGAILDLLITLHADAWSVNPWVVQSDIPVIESRYVVTPPQGFGYRTAVATLPPEKAKSEKMRTAFGMTNYWIFENVPPLPDEANAPPAEEISQKVMIIPEEYKDEIVYVAI